MLTLLLITVLGLIHTITAQFRPYAVDGSYYLPVRQRGELAPPNWLYNQAADKSSDNNSPFFGTGSNVEDSRQGDLLTDAGMGSALGDIIDNGKDLNISDMKPSPSTNIMKPPKRSNFRLSPTKQRPIINTFNSTPHSYHVIH